MKFVFLNDSDIAPEAVRDENVADDSGTAKDTSLTSDHPVPSPTPSKRETPPPDVKSPQKETSQNSEASQNETPLNPSSELTDAGMLMSTDTGVETAALPTPALPATSTTTTLSSSSLLVAGHSRVTLSSATSAFHQQKQQREFDEACRQESLRKYLQEKENKLFFEREQARKAFEQEQWKVEREFQNGLWKEFLKCRKERIGEIHAGVETLENGTSGVSAIDGVDANKQESVVQVGKPESGQLTEVTSSSSSMDIVNHVGAPSDNRDPTTENPVAAIARAPLCVSTGLDAVLRGLVSRTLPTPSGSEIVAGGKSSTSSNASVNIGGGTVTGNTNNIMTLDSNTDADNTLVVSDAAISELRNPGRIIELCPQDWSQNAAQQFLVKIAVDFAMQQFNNSNSGTGDHDGTGANESVTGGVECVLLLTLSRKVIDLLQGMLKRACLGDLNFAEEEKKEEEKKEGEEEKDNNLPDPNQKLEEEKQQSAKTSVFRKKMLKQRRLDCLRSASQHVIVRVVDSLEELFAVLEYLITHQQQSFGSDEVSRLKYVDFSTWLKARQRDQQNVHNDTTAKSSNDNHTKSSSSKPSTISGIESSNRVIRLILIDSLTLLLAQYGAAEKVKCLGQSAGDDPSVEGKDATENDVNENEADVHNVPVTIYNSAVPLFVKRSLRRTALADRLRRRLVDGKRNSDNTNVRKSGGKELKRSNSGGKHCVIAFMKSNSSSSKPPNTKSSWKNSIYGQADRLRLLLTGLPVVSIYSSHLDWVYQNSISGVDQNVSSGGEDQSDAVDPPRPVNPSKRLGPPLGKRWRNFPHERVFVQHVRGGGFAVAVGGRSDDWENGKKGGEVGVKKDGVRVSSFFVE